jgi:hypothetical protein
MKQIFLTFICLTVLILTLNAQTPQAINYQGVARGNDGNVLVNQNLSIKLSILSDSINGTAEFIECHSKTTDGNGLFTLQIGQGSGQFGVFNTINWGAKTYYLKVEIDPTGGLSYQYAGTSLFVSVPYALYAENARNGFSGDYNDLSNLPLLFDWEYSSLIGKPTTLGGYGIMNGMSTSHPANSITTSLISKWNMAYSWGNHAGLYRPISYVPSWGQITSNPFQFTSSVNNQILRYNSTTGKWENWTPDYLTNYAETDPVFVAWDKSSGIIVTVSQISDFNEGVTNNAAVLANTAKISYPLADAAKLAGIADSAEQNVNADWNATNGDAQILNKPVFSTVALTGNYNDLGSKPEGTQVGDMLYWNGTTWQRVPVGNSGQVLVLVDSVPTWGQSYISVPIVHTTQAYNISSNAALSGGYCSDGGSPITVRGVCWSTSENPTILDSKTADGPGSGAYISNISSLEANTTYHVRAYATNNIGTSYGEDLPFSTTAFTTNGISGITSNSAIGGGVILGDGGSTITARGVCWHTSSTPTISNEKTTNGSGTGSFTSTISNLSGNTKYFVRAYYINSLGVFYANEVSFITNPVVPVVTTGDTLNLTTTTAQIHNSNVTNDGGGNIIERGVCWGTASNPTTAGNRTIDGNGLGLFSSTISGLSPNTTYKVKAYAINSLGTAYGSEKTLTTKGIKASLTTDDVDGITQTSAVVYGSVSSQGSSSVTERGFCWKKDEVNPTISNNKISCGSGIGSFNGILTLLASNSTYHVRAYAITAQGVSYGTDYTFSTLPGYYEGFESAYPAGWNGMWSLSTSNDYEGFYSLFSDHTGDTVSFTRTISTPEGGQVSFWYLASNYNCSYGSYHADTPTRTQFFIDGVLKTTCTNTTWSVITFPITSGTHTFKWKNIGRAGTSYCWSDGFDGNAWIDYFLCTD